jgi:hypothetical protein
VRDGKMGWRRHARPRRQNRSKRRSGKSRRMNSSAFERPIGRRMGGLHGRRIPVIPGPHTPWDHGAFPGRTGAMPAQGRSGRRAISSGGSAAGKGWGTTTNEGGFLLRGAVGDLCGAQSGGPRPMTTLAQPGFEISADHALLSGLAPRSGGMGPRSARGRYASRYVDIPINPRARSPRRRDDGTGRGLDDDRTDRHPDAMGTVESRPEGVGYCRDRSGHAGSWGTIGAAMVKVPSDHGATNTVEFVCWYRRGAIV